jgi:predicted component of viral defense system (DUF524 family)
MSSLVSLTIRWHDQVEISFLSDQDSPSGSEQFLGRLGSAAVSGVFDTEPRPADSISSLAFTVDPEGLFQPIRLLEETPYQLVIHLPYSKATCIEMRMRSESRIWPFNNLQLLRSVQVVLPRLWTENHTQTSTQIPVLLNARSQAGCVDLSFLNVTHPLFVEVMTAKITYEDEFKRLVTEIADAQVQLAYEVGASSGLSLRTSVLTTEDLPSLLFHLRRLMGPAELPAAIETIANNPFSSTVWENTSRNNGSQNIPNPAAFAKQLRNIRFRPGGPFSSLFRGMSPESLPGLRRMETLDIAENRYVKHFLLTLENLLIRLETACKDDKKLIALGDVSRWRETVRDWLSLSLWRDVGELSSFPSNSQRLQRSVGYQDVLAADMIIKQSLALPWTESSVGTDLIVADVKPVSDLYEYWCFFMVRGILQSMFGPDQLSGKGLTVTSAHGLSIRLAAMTDGRGCVFLLPEERGKLHLFYNRRFRSIAGAGWGDWSGTYSIDFDPDISIAIELPSGQTHWLNFDAKYKVQRFMWTDADGVGPVERTTQKEYKQEDLNKMHCYRDAILGTRGSYILYPGSTDLKDVYVRRVEAPRRAEGLPGVGAFALRPGNNRQREVLSSFISHCIQMVVGAAGYQEETGLY